MLYVRAYVCVYVCSYHPQNLFEYHYALSQFASIISILFALALLAKYTIARKNKPKNSRFATKRKLFTRFVVYFISVALEFNLISLRICFCLDRWFSSNRKWLTIIEFRRSFFIRFLLQLIQWNHKLKVCIWKWFIGDDRMHLERFHRLVI